ncbi:hypothetical Protein YC6258_03929 [Gynuella sunshinyii YC6258]|uniref:Uncharacterized protein n=1 Tax=Gynuella sunshinyii YC6258 TaxID=1445510 RepID=A0A0C5V9B7_9GAMM|nr:hypothetical Protein YC6258_03929 [Gynuella sunshinyii YC6258]
MDPCFLSLPLVLSSVRYMNEEFKDSCVVMKSALMIERRTSLLTKQPLS